MFTADPEFLGWDELCVSRLVQSLQENWSLVIGEYNQNTPCLTNQEEALSQVWRGIYDYKALIGLD